MILKADKDLSQSERYNYTSAAEKVKGIHIREVAIHYMLNEDDDKRTLVGTLSPFCSYYNELELAMIADYESYFNGGEVTVETYSGAFMISFNKGEKQ